MRLSNQDHSDARNRFEPQNGNILAEPREPRPVFSTPALSAETFVAEKLSEAKEAAQLGDYQQAYRFCREVTTAVPDNIDAWLLRGTLADTYEDRLASLSKAVALAPEHSTAKHTLYDVLKRYLEEEPFLRYIEETETLYRVLTGEGRAVIVPKDRAVSLPYPPPEPTPLQPIFRWLALAMLGLMFAGLGAVICAPVAALLAWRTSQLPLTQQQRRRVGIAFVYANALFGIGLLLSFIFLLHL